MSVKTIVDKHGVALTYRHFTSVGTYDPATGSTSGATYTDYTIKGYIFNFKLDEIDGTSVVKGDRKLLTYTTDTSGTAIPKPSVGDTFSGYGDKVSVVSVTEIISRGVTSVYIIQVRE